MTLPSEDKRFHAEQIKRAHELIPISCIGNVVPALVLTLTLWPVIPHPASLVWLSVVVVFAGIDYGSYRAYHRCATAWDRPQRWYRWFLVRTAVIGTVWGGGGVFLFATGSAIHQYLLVLFLAGMVAGAAGILSLFLISFMLFSLPIIVPITLMFLYIGGENNMYVGGLIPFFWLMMYFTAKRSNAVHQKTLVLMFEKADLVQHLERANIQAEQTNDALKLEIAHRQKAEAQLKQHQERLSDMVEERTARLKTANEKLLSEYTERLRAEDALRESEGKYRLVVENSSEGIIVTQDGMLKLVNPMVSKMCGHSQEALLTKSFLEFVHPEDKEMVVTHHIKRLKGQTSGTCDFRMVRKDGKMMWVESNGVVITWQGKPATLNFLNDISHRKHARELMRYKELFDSVADGVFILDEAGRFIETNDRVLEKTGYTREELFKLNIRDLALPSRIPALVQALKTAEQEKQMRFEISFKTKTSAVLLFDISCRRVSFLAKDCFLCVHSYTSCR